MSKQKSLKLNFIMNALLTMSSFIFPLITFKYVSNILLPVGTGKVSFATSFISYFAMFAQLGIPTYGIRACARVREDKEKLTKTVHELFIINAVMSVISYVILFVLIFLLPKTRDEKPLYMIVSLTLFFNLIGMEWLFKGLEQYTYITVRSIAFKIIALIMMFLLIHEQKDYVIYGALTIFASSAAHIMNFFYARKFISFRPLKHYDIKPHLYAVAIFFAMACATTIYTHLDSVMLGFMKTDEDVGYYNAAVKIKTILVSIVTSLGTVLLPRASYYVRQGKMDEFRKISTKALNFVFLLATPLFVFFMLYASEGIDFLSSTLYLEAVVPMRIIMPTLLFIGITNILGIQILVPLGKEKVVLYSEIAGAVTDLVLNAILIPKLASSGAAIGTLVAEFVVLVVQFVALKYEVIGAFKAIKYWKIIIGTAISLAAAASVKFMGLGTFLTLLVAAVIFFSVYYVFLLLTKEQLVADITAQVMGKILKKRREN